MIHCWYWSTREANLLYWCWSSSKTSILCLMLNDMENKYILIMLNYWKTDILYWFWLTWKTSVHYWCWIIWKTCILYWCWFSWKTDILYFQFFHWLQMSTGNLLVVLGEHYLTVTAIRFTDDSNHFVTGGDDGIVAVWNLAELVSEESCLVLRIIYTRILVIWIKHDRDNRIIKIIGYCEVRF